MECLEDICMFLEGKGHTGAVTEADVLVKVSVQALIMTLQDKSKPL